MAEPTPEQIAWAAGLFEGEGSMSLHREYRVQLYLGMTDEDVVRHFYEIVDAGNVYVKDRSAHGDKTLYAWHCAKSADVKRILGWFLPWLHDRRGARAVEMLERLAKNPGPKADWTHCPNGHPFSGEHLYIHAKTGKRMCRTCATARHQRWMAKQREAVS